MLGTGDGRVSSTKHPAPKKELMKTILIPKIVLLFLCLGLGGPGLQAQFQINGNVSFGEGLEPVPDYEVNAYLPVHDQQYRVLTDAEGNYAFHFDWTSAEILEAQVSVVDLCTGDVKIIDLPSDDGGYVANFRLCQGIDPPPPPPGCRAYFTYEQLGVDPLTVLFLDLSYHSDSTILYEWDFGDGSPVSAEPAPTHAYTEIGVYQVSLTISSGDCTSTTVQSVVVQETLDCVCPAVYNPVCVLLDDGTQVIFSNSCEAQCAGFTEEDWSSCEPNECGCPEFYDPVCVAGPNGDTLTFSNHCFAECAGYEPDQFYPCNPINECDCAPIDYPVCVVNDAGEILRFPNECLARCAGYPPTSIVDCNIACTCPEYYDPVCVVVGIDSFPYPVMDTLTFPNICFAECAGFGADQVFHCNPDGGCQCPDEYDPVCVVGPDGQMITFQNACVANCRGYEEEEFIDCAANCICPAVYDPVCVYTASGEQIRFNNRCEAECAGFGPDQIVRCEPEECLWLCVEIYDPVCVVENGVTLTFDNECFARCAGYTEADYFKCEPKECNCPDIYDPVCIVTDFGPAYWFVNACQAECAGFGPDQYESCGPDDCICPDVYDPVCVVVAIDSFPGQIIDTLTFSNRCEAVCAGFGEDQIFPCYPGPVCDCDDIYDPVCVYTPGGQILRFYNPCEARCAGYDETIWVKCGEIDCEARFGVEHPNTGELGVQFINYSFPVTDSLDIKWLWDFGDGTVSEERDPYHEYAKEGIYEVRLTITTADGCTDTHREQVVVGLYGPVDSCKAMFFFEQQPDDPYAFQFMDMSLGDIVAWNWYFGDGTTSNESAPQHTYTQAGIYIVSLSITGADGCTSLVSMLVATADDIVYNPDCHALFLPVIVPETNQVYFLNFSSQDVVTVEWDFGDGTGSDVFMPTHTYEASGSYVVNLTVVTAADCTNSYSATINLAGGSFTASPAYSFLGTTDVEEPEVTPLSVRLFPNPVRTQLWLDLESTQGGPLQWRILNLNGQEMRQGRQELSAGQQRFSIETGELPSGLYALQLLVEGRMVTKRFVRDGARY